MAETGAPSEPVLPATASGKSPRREALAAFVRGCIEPSRLALGIAFTLTVVVYAGLLLGLTPDRFTRLAGWFARDRRDDHAFVTALAMQLRDKPDPATILFIGASGLMESVDAKEVESQVGCGGEPLRVRTLATRGQTVVESAELLDALDGFQKGVLVLGLGPKRLAVTNQEIEGSRLGLLIPGVREGAPFFARRTERSGNYFWDNRSFFMARLPFLAARVASGHRASFVTTSFIGRTSTLREDDVGRERLEGFDLWWTHHPTGFEILARMQQGMKVRRDVRVVYLTAPHNDGFFKDGKRAGVFADYSERMRAFAEANGTPFWDLDAEAGLQPSDFYDYSHLKNRAARERYTRVLSARLRPLVGCP